MFIIKDFPVPIHNCQ